MLDMAIIVNFCWIHDLVVEESEVTQYTILAYISSQ